MKTTHGRPLPFVLKVAAEWMRIEDALGPTDGPLFFQQKMSLTGNLSISDNGKNVEFSDMGLLNDPYTN